MTDLEFCIDNQFKSLYKQTGQHFSIYQESGIYTLTLHGIVLEIGTGKEILKCISAIRTYHSVTKSEK